MSNHHQFQETTSKDTSPMVCPFLHNRKESLNQVDHLKIKGSTEEESTNLRKCCFVELKDTASYLNLSTYYLVQFSYVCFFAFMDSMQPHLLDPKSKYISDIYTDEQARSVNLDLLFYDNLYLVGFIYIFGAFHDVIGRKLVCSIGFLLISISLFLYPIAGCVYPNLILIRLLFSNGVCAVTTQPLLADYVKHTSKGFCGGIAALLSGFGALFSVFVLLGLKKFVSIGQVYFITSGFCLFVSGFCLFGVKNVNVDNSRSCGVRIVQIYAKLKIGCKEVIGNLKLSLGIITNMQARMNSILMTLMLVIWVKHYTEDYDNAYNRAMFISGVSSCVGMVSAILFGFFYEKANIKYLLGLNNACIVIGYLSLIFLDPLNNLVFLSFGIAAFGFYGLTTVGYIIVNKNVGCSARGAVMGLNSFVGAVGILFLTKIGDLLVDHITILAPFFISALISLIMLLLIFIPKIYNQLESDKEEEPSSESPNESPKSDATGASSS